MFTQPVNSNMSDFIIKKLPHDLSYHARLAFIGKYLRLVVARNRETACQQQQERKSRINELESLASAWVGKLDEQEQGAKKRGRKLLDSGAQARFYHAVCEAHLGKIVMLDMKADCSATALMSRRCVWPS